MSVEGNRDTPRGPSGCLYVSPPPLSPAQVPHGRPFLSHRGVPKGEEGGARGEVTGTESWDLLAPGPCGPVQGPPAP